MGYGHGDSAIYIGGTPIQDRTPNWTKIDHNETLRERARLLRDQLAVRRLIKNSDCLQQRHRPRPEHARFRAVRAGRRRQRSTTTTSSGTTSTTTCRTRASRPSPAASARSAATTLNYPTGIGVVLFGATGWKVSQQQHLRQLQVGLGRVLGSVQRRRRRDEHRQPVHRTTRTAAAAPTPTASTSGSTAPASGNCFPGNQQLDVRSERHVPTALAVPDLPGAAAAGSGTGTSVGDGDPARRADRLRRRRPARDAWSAAGTSTRTRRSRTSSRSTSRRATRTAAERATELRDEANGTDAARRRGAAW